VELRIGIADCGFIGCEIEIENRIHLQFAICNSQSAIRNPHGRRAWHCDCPRYLTLHPHRARADQRNGSLVNADNLDVWGLNAE
jgi:hypothetical protein